MVQITRVLERTLIVIGSALVVLMVVLMNAEVISRYGLGVSLLIADEYSGYMFAAATVLCFTPALMRERFIRINFLPSLLPVRGRAVLELLIALVSAAYSSVLALQTWKIFTASREFGSTSLYYSATPIMYPQFILPVGFGLLTIAIVLRGVGRTINLWQGKRPADEDDLNVIE